MFKKLFQRTPSPPPVAPEPPEPPTLKARVAAFWEWYRSVAERFYADIEAKRAYDLAQEASEKVHEFLPGMMWVFGPGENGEGHSFTRTAEGDDHRRFVAQYWLSRAPSLPGWTFYPSRQAGKTHGKIKIEELTFAAHEVWLTPRIDEENESVHISVWHPLFDQIAENLRSAVTALWLDEALGEDTAWNWIGSVEFSNTELAGAIPLSELPEFITGLKQQKGWEKDPPHEAWHAYETENRQPAGLRRDIIVGKTLSMRVLNEYPYQTNPLEELGAEYAMLVFPREILPRGSEVDRRYELEDLLNDALGQEASGIVIGGAIGIKNAYIDLLLYDGENSKKLVRGALVETELAGNFRLLDFLEQYKTHSGAE